MSLWQWWQLISFQAIWFACILGRNQWIALPLCLLCIHFALTPSRSADGKVLLLATLGFGIDLVLTEFGVFDFAQRPYWLGVLWIGFVLSFGHSLLFLRKLTLPWLAFIGAGAGSYAYLISWKLGAVELPNGGIITGLIVAVIWALTLPLYVRVDLWIRSRS